jgi:hypothetical protein
MQITALLQRVHDGDQEALHTVIPLVYSELKKLAAGHLRRNERFGPSTPRRWCTRRFSASPAGNSRRMKTAPIFLGSLRD